MHEFYYSTTKSKGINLRLPLVFIDSVHLLNNFLDNLVKNLCENDFCHLSQEFNANLLDLLNKNIIFPYDSWNSFEKFIEGLPSKHKFDNILTNCEITEKNMNIMLMFAKLLK